jgi:putative transposase
LSICRQCELLDLSRSSFYYEPATESPENLMLMRLMDEEYTRHPCYGSRRMTVWLHREGHEVNRKRVQRLMRLMGLEAVYPKPNLSAANSQHKVYPYLLRNVPIVRPDQVWSTDITYVPLPCGFMYLAAVIDWYSRYVISWRLSNTLDGSFCLEMLEEALSRGKPEVFNTDQGVQFTARAWTARLESAGVQVSMDGGGRCLDNVFVERLWRTVKYEDVYLRGYETMGSTSPVAAPGCRASLVSFAPGLRRKLRLGKGIEHFRPRRVERRHERSPPRPPTQATGRPRLEAYPIS